MAHHQVTGYSETHDLFAYLIAALPKGFCPRSRERSLDDWFTILLRGVDSVVMSSGDTYTARLLEHVKSACVESRDLYESEQARAGSLQLQYADQLFSEVARLPIVEARMAQAEWSARELADLDIRLERLRHRLGQEDPDMTPDELQAAIERVEAQRRQLQLGAFGGTM